MKWITVFSAALLVTFPVLAPHASAAEPPATPPTAPATVTPPTPAAAPPVAETAALPAPPDVAAPPADAQTTASGLASKVLKPGTGTPHPGPADMVKVDYTGWTTDGKIFDSSISRGQPAVLPLA